MHPPVFLLTLLGALCCAAPVHAAPASHKRTPALTDSSNATSLSSLLSVLENQKPGPTPASLEEAVSRLTSAYASAKPSGYFEAATQLISLGLASNNFKHVAAGFGVEDNSTNINTRNPSRKIYPKFAKQDAPYGQSEDALRQHIYIPSTFTFGEKHPVILVPGTAGRGGNDFAGNLIPLLSGKSYADLVWLNPNGFMLADAQTNAENVAYAIHYISSISKNRKVSIVGWSQASMSMQWALKYWPSTRQLVTNQIAVSADYHGTKLAYLIDGGGILTDNGALIPTAPSIVQQDYNSNFVKTLRSNGGDSAYVPTTTIYSGVFDEIVEPQQGTGASAFLKDAHGVGVSNNEIQTTCPKGSPGAGLYDHESALMSPLTLALIEDAITNNGLGLASRLNLDTVCSTYLAPGIGLPEFLATESTIPLFFLNAALFEPKVTAEPPIRGYAM